LLFSGTEATEHGRNGACKKGRKAKTLQLNVKQAIPLQKSLSLTLWYEGRKMPHTNNADRRPQNKTEVLFRSSLFWDDAERRLVVDYRRFGTMQWAELPRVKYCEKNAGKQVDVSFRRDYFPKI
jgi:hypothetical protein